MNEIIHLTE